MMEEIIGERGNSVTLTKSDKEKPELQKFLTIFARSDAAHDLNKAFTFTAPYPAIFAKGLPEGKDPWRIGDEHYSENQFLNSVILQIDNKNVDDSASVNLNRICNDITEGTIATEPKDITIGYSFLDKNFFKPLYPYTVCKTYITTSKENNEEVDVKNFFDIYNNPTDYDSEFGKKFYEDTDLGNGTGKKIGFIIDFALHKFLKKLNNPSPNSPQYYNLVTSAVLNDPASKANPYDRTTFNNNVHSLVETTGKDTYFTNFDPKNPNINNNFYSSYDLVLSKIIETRKGPKDIVFNTNLIVTSADKIVNTSDNNEPSSRFQNSNLTVISYINDIKEKLLSLWVGKTALKNKLTVQFNSKCQEKRIGDSGQALSCCDIKNKIFKEILPNNEQPFITINDDFVNYYVSHDKLAVAYALLLGLNVIYFDFYGRIFVFKNKNYFGQLALPAKEQQIWEHIKSNQEYFDESFKYAHIFSETISVKFTDQISDYSYGKIIKNLDEIVIPTNDKSIIIKILKDIFKEAVTAQFIKINIPNITLEEINAREIIYKMETPNNANEVNKLHDFLNMIDSIKQKFETPTEAVVNKWIQKNIDKMEFYKVIDQILTIEQTRRSPRFLYLTNLLQGTPNGEVSTDKYIFLPYLQNLDSEIKARVINKLVEIKNAMNVFINDKLKDTPIEPGVRKTRTWYENIIRSPNKAISENVDFKFYTNTINLLAEANIFLSYDDTSNSARGGNQRGGASELDNLEAFENYEDVIIDEDFKSIRLHQFYLPDEPTPEEDKEAAADEEVKKPVADVPIDTNGDANPNIDLKGGKSISQQFSIINPSSNIITDFNIFHITWPYLKYNLMLSLDLVRDGKFKEIMQKMKTNRIFIKFRELGREQNEDDYGLSEFLPRNGGSNKNELLKSLTGGSREEDITEIKAILDSEKFKEDFNEFKILDSEELVNEQNNNELIITDRSLFYHPLLPIYMLLTAFYYSLEPKFDSDPFNDSYITYYYILEEITNVIISYLTKPGDNNQVKNSYIIGLGLGYMLIMAPNEFLNISKILSLHDNETNNYLNDSFIPISSSLSFSVLSGATLIENKNIPYAYLILNSLIFKGFIEKVNIPEVIKTKTEKLEEDYLSLGRKVYNLMSIINNKVTEDRYDSVLDIQVKSKIKIKPEPTNVLDQPVNADNEQVLNTPNKYSSPSNTAPMTSESNDAGSEIDPEEIKLKPQTLFSSQRKRIGCTGNNCVISGGKTYKKNQKRKKITIKKNQKRKKITIKKNQKRRRITIKKNKNYRKKTIKHKRIKRNTRMLKLKIN